MDRLGLAGVRLTKLASDKGTASAVKWSTTGGDRLQPFDDLLAPLRRLRPHSWDGRGGLATDIAHPEIPEILVLVDRVEAFGEGTTHSGWGTFRASWRIGI